LSLEINAKRIFDRMEATRWRPKENSADFSWRQDPALQRLTTRIDQQEEPKSMTVCKACGGEISFTRLEEHICPTPNREFEKERDKYREAARERGARDERLGIMEVPAAPVWVYLEILLNDGKVLKYALRRNDFSFAGNRLLIDPEATGGWSERIFVRSIRSYRFREFGDEAEARALAQSGGEISTRDAGGNRGA
jgi:hypothetical protein